MVETGRQMQATDFLSRLLIKSCLGSATTVDTYSRYPLSYRQPVVSANGFAVFIWCQSQLNYQRPPSLSSRQRSVHGTGTALPLWLVPDGDELANTLVIKITTEDGKRWLVCEVHWDSFWPRPRTVVSS